MQPHDAKGRDGEQFAAPNAEPDSSQWRTVAEVAALLGVSERAVQKRCTAGTLSAHRIETPKGAVWEIDAGNITASQNRAVRRAEPNAKSSPNRTVRNAEPVTQPDDAPDFATRYVEHLESENDFLRRALEQRDRDAAELRAALREALKVQTRQLTTATEVPETALNRVPTPSPYTDTQKPLTPAESQQTKTGAASREPRPLWRVILGIR